jgi:hypothetical protein
MSRYALVISEPCGFRATDGSNQIVVGFIAIVPVGDAARGFTDAALLSLEPPFDIKGALASNLLAFPRYWGDAVDDVLCNSVSANIAVLMSTELPGPEAPITLDSLKPWAIGHLKPIAVQNDEQGAS